MDVDDVLRAYLTCALWTATNEVGDAYDGYEDAMDDLPAETVAEARETVVGFLAYLDEAFEEFPLTDAVQTGHDLYLTSARHGCGFWDRGLTDRYARQFLDGDYGPWLRDPQMTALRRESLPMGWEVRELGDILTDIAHTFSPPNIQIEDEDGVWWTA